MGVSVKELVKAMGESRANGNGATPPETPRRTSRSSSPKNPQGGSPRFHSPSSSPVPIPGTYVLFASVKICVIINSLSTELFRNSFLKLYIRVCILYNLTLQSLLKMKLFQKL